MLPPWPRVGVARSKFVRGVASLDRLDGIEFLEPLDLPTAAERRWPTDAHFVTYDVTCEAQFPRLRKSVRAALQAMGAGPVTRYLVFDYDNPGHVAWSALDVDAPGRFLRLVESLPGPLGLWSCLYATRGGARLIYVLPHALPVDEAEERHRGMVERLRAAGLAVDPACSDWTRLFRLPNVTRDAAPTWLQGAQAFPLALRAVTLSPRDVATLPRIVRRTGPEAPPIDDEQPGLEEVGALLEPEAVERARAALQWTRIMPILEGSASLTSLDASRHVAINRAVGIVVQALVSEPWASPALVYALLFDPVAAMGPAPGDRDFHDEMWKCVTVFWPRDVARLQAAAEAAGIEEPPPNPPPTEEDIAAARKRAQDVAERVHAGHGDPGHPFEPGALASLCLLRSLDQAEWHRVRALLKRGGVVLRDLDRAMQAHDAAEAPEPADEEAPEDHEALLDIIASRVDFFRTADRAPFGTIEVAGHRETWSLRSSTFSSWLRGEFFAACGRALPQGRLDGAIETLVSRAEFEGEERPVFLRVAALDGTIYVDLGDPAWRAVAVDVTGWRVVSDPPVRFRRAASMLPLPEPERGGSLADLWPLVNVPEDVRPLVAGWLVSALSPRAPYPVLVVQGEQGSAKSSLCRVLRDLVDPSEPRAGRSMSGEERDLLVAAKGAHCLFFDNLSGLEPWAADAICRLATGGGFGARRLYTDDEEVIISVARPVILNGIDSLVTRADLASRAIVLDLPAVRWRAESDLQAALTAARPRIFGALLDGLSAALRGIDEAKRRVEGTTRMVDSAAWATAAETALGFASGAFLAALERCHGGMVDQSIDAEPVARAVMSFVRRQRGASWRGSPSDLFDHLSREREAGSRNWPANPQRFSDRLKRLEPSLRAIGVQVTHGRTGKGRWLEVVGGEVTRAAGATPLRHQGSSPTHAALAPGVKQVGDAGDASSSSQQQEEDEETGGPGNGD